MRDKAKMKSMMNDFIIVAAVIFIFLGILGAGAYATHTLNGHYPEHIGLVGETLLDVCWFFVSGFVALYSAQKIERRLLKL